MNKVLTAEIAFMILCFIMAWYHRNQEWYTLGEFMLLLFIVTCAVAMNKNDKKRDE